MLLHDNNIVSFLSNGVSVNPIHSVIQNAWHLHCNNGDDFDLLKFRRTVATILLLQNKNQRFTKKDIRLIKIA